MASGAGGFARGFTGGLNAATAANRGNIAGQLGFEQLKLGREKLASSEKLATAALDRETALQTSDTALSNMKQLQVEFATSIKEQGPDAAKKLLASPNFIQSTKILAAQISAVPGRSVTPEQVMRSFQNRVALGGTPEGAGRVTGQTAAAANEGELGRPLTEAEKAKKLDIDITRETEVVKTRAPNGDLIATLIYSDDGEKIRELGRGPVVGTQLDEVPGAKSKDFAELEDTEIFTRNAINAGFDLVKLIREGGEAATSGAGAFASGVNNLRATVVGFAQLSGVKTDTFEDGTSTINMDTKAEGIFKEMKIAATLNAQQKSLITNLAFTAAAASGQSGRSISDKDFERFVKEIGGSIKDPDIFEGVINKFMERLNKNFQTRFKVKVGSGRFPGKDPNSPPDPLADIRAERGIKAAPPPPGTAAAPQIGDTATNPTTGARLVLTEQGWQPIQ